MKYNQFLIIIIFVIASNLLLAMQPEDSLFERGPRSDSPESSEYEKAGALGLPQSAQEELLDGIKRQNIDKIKSAIRMLNSVDFPVRFYNGFMVQGQTPLSLAIITGASAEVVETLLEAQANPYIPDWHGVSAWNRVQNLNNQYKELLLQRAAKKRKY